MDLDLIDLFKLLAAIGAGALIGVERELAAKPAGLRTNILICLGAALFTMLSVKIADAAHLADRGRIAAQIVTGVGFLGAGAIIQHRRYVVGLTTAATIWAVASIGMAFGAAEFAVGGVGLLLTATVLFGLGFAEGFVEKWRTAARVEIELDRTVDPVALVQQLAQEHGVRWKIGSVNKTPEGFMGRFKITGSFAHIQSFWRALLVCEQIRAVKRL